MLFVSEIVPIEYGQRRVFVSDTESDFVGEIIFGEYVTEAQIRFRAPTVIESTAAFKKYKRKKETN